MIGTIGFVSAGLVIASFAWTSNHAYRSIPGAYRTPFVTAYGLLATTMFVWAAATLATTDATLLRALMLSTDCLLILGTGFCLTILFEDMRRWWELSLFGVTGSLLIGMRAFFYPPQAFVANGLLHFNLTLSQLYIILGAMLFIWLPASYMIAVLATREARLAPLRKPLSFFFGSLVLFSAAFITAHKNVMIIGLFAGVVALFALGTYVNIVIMRPVKRSKKHARPAK